MSVLGHKVAVLLAADGAAWEVGALRSLETPGSAAVLLKRCVDLPDLLATATTGQAQVAVVAGDIAGLDGDSVAHLRRCGVATVLVAGHVRADTHALPGLAAVVDDTALDRLAEEVVAAAAVTDEGAQPVTVSPPTGPTGVPDDAPGAGRTVTVWGPAGAPGRTTVAVGLAAEIADRGVDTLLVDADGYGGAVAQHLGVLDEVSGLLSAVRSANAGRLDPTGLAAAARAVLPTLRVLTGLPRADRWVEVRAAAFDAVLEQARRLSDLTVLDVGFCLEEDAFGHGGPQRNQMTLAGLDLADEVVVVGAADPVGLSRLARGLVEVRDHVPLGAVHVVVNRMRPTVGWGEDEVRAMIEQFLTPASTHFLPHDQPAVDRALTSGRPPTELPDAPLRRALGRLADAIGGAPAASAAASRRGVGPRGLRRRRAGRAR